MTPEKQDKTLELSKHWSVDSTPARNEVTMKRTYPVKSVKCDKICSNQVISDIPNHIYPSLECHPGMCLYFFVHSL